MTSERVFVYVIASGDYVKVGISNNPQKRLAALSTGMPERAFKIREERAEMERMWGQHASAIDAMLRKSINPLGSPPTDGGMNG